jgi:hypothetical protein
VAGRLNSKNPQGLSRVFSLPQFPAEEKSAVIIPSKQVSAKTSRKLAPSRQEHKEFIHE